MNVKSPLLLSDEQMREFITQGYLILRTDFSDSFHERLTEQLTQVYEQEGNPGNNLLPRIRDLQKVFDHPAVVGALTSVLGPNYMLHAHRHGHYNASDKPGGWHKDSYWGYRKMRNHHPWWAMIMYFPQDTPIELGPTGVMPGTQNHETRTFAADELKEEALAAGKAGTFALIHYDLWHRSTPNVLGQHRYMLKFEFMRTEAPSKPSWNHIAPSWQLPAALNAPIARHDAMWEETWSWLSGRIGGLNGTARGGADAAASITALSAQLQDEFEPNALNAAYELARYGDEGVHILLAALQAEPNLASRCAAYGLSVCGSTAAVQGLMMALGSGNERTAKRAAFALGELRQLAAAAVPALIERLGRASEPVRQTIVEALGMIGEPSAAVTAGLISGLQDSDTQVRFMSGLAICRLGAKAEAAIPQLELAMEDENRYVRAHAAEALHYIGTERAKDVLIKHLLQSRWCPTTNRENAFYP